MDTLNKEQKQAVLHTEGPLLVVAGAGSGKTRVLTQKIAYLIEEMHISPYAVLAITFTNKAAQEMKTRVADLLEMDVDSMWIGTFHSVCGRVLRRSIDKLGYTSNFTIYDRDDQKALVKEILKEMQTSDASLNINGIISQISLAKNNGISPQAFRKDNQIYPDGRITAEIYDRYEEKTKLYNALDFDDLILKTLELFEKHPEVLEDYQRRFRYVFVDEYQDTNYTQYKLVKAFSGFHKNVCVVGDGDQSIYGWRGAEISNILDFEKDFPGARTILLEQNYRSTKSILNVANTLIKHNQERKVKNLWTSREEGKDVVYKQCSSEDGEVYNVITYLNELRFDGYKLSDIAILYRTNAQSREFEEGFMREGIPYRVIGGLRFYDRKEIKDVIAYLKVLVNPNDDIALKRIINTPKRGIGNATIEKLDLMAYEGGKSIYQIVKEKPDLPELTKRASNQIGLFVAMIEKLRKNMLMYSLEEIVRSVLDASGYMNELKSSRSPDDVARVDNVEAFVNAVSSYEEAYPGTDLETYMQSVSLMSDLDKTADQKSGVDLMTIHSAKGLEYPVVFVTGMEEGLFPSKRAIEEGNIEEERRLCYVALTRAKDRLYLSGTSMRRTYGQLKPAMRSRFIEEMGDSIQIIEERTPEPVVNFRESTLSSDIEQMKKSIRASVLERKRRMQEKSTESFRVGDKVFHKSFGDGLVVSVTPNPSGDELVISFEKKGIKRLNADLAPLKRRDD